MTLLTTKTVARLLQVSPSRVRQLDPELKPARTDGGIRLYDPKKVALFVEQREARIAQRQRIKHEEQKAIREFQNELRRLKLQRHEEQKAVHEFSNGLKQLKTRCSEI